MITVKKRLQFKCYACSREYSRFVNEAEASVLLTACPFCNTEAEVDLAPFRSKIETTLRGGDGAPTETAAYTFPDVLETSARGTSTSSDESES